MAVSTCVRDNGCRTKRTFSGVHVGVKLGLCAAVGAGIDARFLDVFVCQPVLYRSLKVQFRDVAGPRARAFNCLNIAAVIANQSMIAGVKP